MKPARLGEHAPVFDRVAVLDRTRSLKMARPTHAHDQFSGAEAMRTAKYLADVVGLAHARQMDRAAISERRHVLTDHRGSGLDAPSRLWKGVVDLTTSHEAGYLERCRRHALNDAAWIPAGGLASGYASRSSRR